MAPTELSYVTALAAGLAAVCVLILLLRGQAASVAAERAVREEARIAREEHAAGARALREEVVAAGKGSADTVVRLLGELRAAQAQQLEGLSQQVNQALREVRESLSLSLTELQAGNEKKLEEMRVTVDEKLHGTLERRLGEAFKQVHDRLEAVHKGLGEMQTLATGVGDLKRVLTNVKSRGIIGEYQLGAILEQILTPDQYTTNYKPREDSGAVVEFAIRLPGRDPSGDPVFLPVDSKFPQEDYLRLQEAVERVDPDALQEATAALVRAVRGCARDISEKYIHPPATTDFGILFLPTEGLYAEVLRQPGLVQDMQRLYSVSIAGPTTFAALLSSLRMGFRTLAIERRSGEVWKVLGAVKAEFGKFGDMLDKVKKQLATASNTLEATGTRTRALERQLRVVEELPGNLPDSIPGLPVAEENPGADALDMDEGEDEGPPGRDA